MIVNIRTKLPDGTTRWVMQRALRDGQVLTCRLYYTVTMRNDSYGRTWASMLLRQARTEMRAAPQ